MYNKKRMELWIYGIKLFVLHFFVQRNVTKDFGKTVGEKSWKKLWSTGWQDTYILY